MTTQKLQKENNELKQIINEFLSRPSDDSADAIDTEDGYTLTPKQILHRKAWKMLKD